MDDLKIHMHVIQGRKQPLGLLTPIAAKSDEKQEIPLLQNFLLTPLMRLYKYILSIHTRTSKVQNVGTAKLDLKPNFMTYPLSLSY